MVVTFENQRSEWLDGVFLDIAGNGRSVAGELLRDGGAVSNNTALNDPAR